MQNRILKNTVVSCLFVVILSVYSCFLLYTSNLQKTMNQQAYSQTMLLMHILETSKEDPVSAIKKIENEIYGRITFVDESGNVTYDSDYEIAQMESHSDRQEIIKARKEGIAINQRMSNTSNKRMYYCAAYVKDIGVVRVGITSAVEIKDVLKNTSPILWGSIVVFMAGILVLSAMTTRRIVDNIEKYDIETGEGEIYEELSPFVQKIKSQNDIIKRQVQTLTDEKIKLQSIFMNIKEGILVCDSRMRIMQTNNEIRKIFGFDEYQSVFSRAVKMPQLVEAMEKALSGETTQLTFEWQGRWYQSITSQNNYHNEKGAILIVLDITQQVESEQNRRRFTDNVTHELKTPLTSIIGYSQLITNDIAEINRTVVSAGVDQIVAQLPTINQTVYGDLASKVSNAASSVQSKNNEVQSSIDKATKASASVDIDEDGLSALLDSVSNSLLAGNIALDNSKSILGTTTDKISRILDEIESVTEGEKYQKLLDIMKNDPSLYGEFLSQPISVTTVPGEFLANS